MDHQAFGKTYDKDASQIHTGDAFFMDLRADLERYSFKEHWPKLLGNTAIWSIVCYRFGRWIYRGDCPKLLRFPCKVIYYTINKLLLEIMMEMFLDVSADIGPGLYIGHTGGIHINPSAKIGRNCDLAHQVTIGASAMGRKGAPTIGDNVYIGSGAKIIGKIKVGNNVRIAANTLVITHVPSGATVMGVPGKVIMQQTN
jgi:serine O-acetyltransferase